MILISSCLLHSTTHPFHPPSFHYPQGQSKVSASPSEAKCEYYSAVCHCFMTYFATSNPNICHYCMLTITDSASGDIEVL